MPGGEIRTLRPTPKAFGAALPLQMIDREGRIFLSF